MPLNPFFYPRENGGLVPVHLEVIQPGQISYFADYSSGEKEYIIAACHPEDEGATLCSVDKSEVHQVEDEPDSITISDLGKLVVVRTIDANFSFDMDFRDEDGVEGRLSLQHVAPYGVPQSNN